LNYQGVQVIGGGVNRHGNGAAALYWDDCFYHVSPETLAPSNSHYIARIIYDNTWQAISDRTTIISDDSGILSISSGLSREPASGSFVMHYQRGDGPIACAVFDAAWNLLTNGNVIDGIWSRPHSVIVSNNLYVGYDGSNINVAVFSISNPVAPVATSTPSFFVRDFDGDRLGDPLLVSSNEWKVWLSGSSYAQGMTFLFPALSSTAPIPAGFTNSSWTICLSSAGYQSLGPETFGAATIFAAAAADYDGDKLADPAVYFEGQWTVWLSSAGYSRIGPVTLGNWSNVAIVSADYDGDAKADPAVWRGGIWRAW
jgi:hypothetical protein